MTEIPNNVLPPLNSFVVYDGIPPREEGQDPTVFYYFPENTPKDDQYNQVGLFLTFTGFSRDFHSSKDCEYFQTDKMFTCFTDIGADIYMAASFQTNSSIYHRILMKSMNVLKSACLMFFQPPSSRSRDGNIDQNSMNHLVQNLKDLLKIFHYLPFFNSIQPSLNVWLLCEETIVKLVSQVPTTKSVAFIHKNELIHSSMNPDELLPIFLVFKYNFLRHYKDFAPKTIPKDKIVWLIGLLNDNQTFAISPNIHLTDNSYGYPIILQYNDIYTIIILSGLKLENHTELLKIQAVLDAVLPQLQSEIQSMNNSYKRAQSEPGHSKTKKKFKKTFSTTTIPNSFLQNENTTGSSYVAPQIFYSSQQFFAHSTMTFNSSKHLEVSNDSIYNSSIFPTQSSLLFLSSVNNTSSNSNTTNSPQTTPKTNRKKRKIGQDEISVYRDNGFLKYISAPDYHQFSDPTKNEEMINFLDCNDNIFVRFYGETKQGILIMEKDDDVTIAVDGLHGDLTNATSDFLKFMKNNKL